MSKQKIKKSYFNEPINVVDVGVYYVSVVGFTIKLLVEISRVCASLGYYMVLPSWFYLVAIIVSLIFSIYIADVVHITKKTIYILAGLMLFWLLVDVPQLVNLIKLNLELLE